MGQRIEWLLAAVFILAALAVVFSTTRDRGLDPRTVRAGWRQQLGDFNAQAANASNIKEVAITWYHDDYGRGERIVRQKDKKAIWVAFKRFHPEAAHIVGYGDGRAQFVLRNGGELLFIPIFLNDGTEFVRTLKACWERGTPGNLDQLRGATKADPAKLKAEWRERLRRFKANAPKASDLLYSFE